MDFGSTDGSIEIAQRVGARVLHRTFDNFANQRNFGVVEGKPTHDWVLHLDADEATTEEFRVRLDALEPREGIYAYLVPSKTIIFRHWLRYAGMYPTYQVRLGHRDRLRFRQVGHGQREELRPEQLAVFGEPYLHYNFSRGLADWLRRHLKYAQDDAHHLVALRKGQREASSKFFGEGKMSCRRFAKDVTSRLPIILRPPARFVYVLFWCRGFLDGEFGLLYALMLSVYEGMVAVLMAEEIIRGVTSDPLVEAPHVAHTSSIAAKMHGGRGEQDHAN